MKDPEGHDDPNPQLAFTAAARLVSLLSSYATDKINEGTSGGKQGRGGATIWPGALREGLGQPELGLVADLAIARSFFVTHTASWQLTVILVPPSMKCIFFSPFWAPKNRNGLV